MYIVSTLQIPDHPYIILTIGGSRSWKNFIIYSNKSSTRYWQDLFICQRSIWSKITIFNYQKRKYMIKAFKWV